jgi:TerC family integral membrane protein
MTASIGNPLLWAVFAAVVLVVLAVDLGVFHRREHAVGPREAAAWTAVWVSLALAFDLWLYFRAGSRPALEFLAGYLVEYALSVDNIFVFIVILGYFAVPKRYQHRVLFWGILGALLLRGTFVALGTALIARFDWVLYLFGLFLVVAGVRVLVHKEPEVRPERNPVVNLLRRLLPLTADYQGKHFFWREQGRLLATPLLVVLLVVETTDLVFAVDSIPAVFGITRDPFLVFTSNIFAVLGLRSLYFLLSGMMDRFQQLGVGLGLVLVFIGLKMLATDFVHVSIQASLAVVVLLLGGAVVASLLTRKRPGAG